MCLILVYHLEAAKNPKNGIKNNNVTIATTTILPPHVDGKIWSELVVAAPNSTKLKIWNIKIPDKNHLLVTILASC